MRSVAGHPQEKYGSHPFTFWQYTGTGVVPGINGNADINVFNGSRSLLAEILEGKYAITRRVLWTRWTHRNFEFIGSGFRKSMTIFGDCHN